MLLKSQTDEFRGRVELPIALGLADDACPNFSGNDGSRRIGTISDESQTTTIDDANATKSSDVGTPTSPTAPLENSPKCEMHDSEQHGDQSPKKPASRRSSFLTLHPTNSIFWDYSKPPHPPREGAGVGTKSWKSLLSGWGGGAPGHAPSKSFMSSSLFGKTQSPTGVYLKPKEGPPADVEVWVEQIIPNWPVASKTSNFFVLLKRGVPHEVRGTVWKNAIGNLLCITPDLYRILLSQVESIRNFLFATSTRYHERIISTFLAFEDSPVAAPVVTGSVTCQDVGGRRFSAHTLDDCHPVLPICCRCGAVQPTPSPRESCPKSSRESDAGSNVPSRPSSYRRSKSRVCSIWDGEILDSFELISVDLNRTIPRNRGPAIGTSQTVAGEESPCGRKRHSRNLIYFSTEGVGKHRGTSPRSSASSAAEARGLFPFVLPNPMLMCGHLRTVLEALAVYRPDIGYIQGMAYVASMFLLHLDEFSTFICLLNLLCRPLLFGFFTFEVPTIELYFETFEILLRDKMPSVAGNLIDKHQLTVDAFLVEWIYTLFTRCLPFEIVARVWDRFFVEGDIVIFQVGLAMMKTFEADLSVGTLDECMNFLSSSAAAQFVAVPVADFFATAHHLNISTRKLTMTIDKIRAKKIVKSPSPNTGGSPTSSAPISPVEPILPPTKTTSRSDPLIRRRGLKSTVRSVSARRRSSPLGVPRGDGRCRQPPRTPGDTGPTPAVSLELDKETTTPTNREDAPVTRTFVQNILGAF